VYRSTRFTGFREPANTIIIGIPDLDRMHQAKYPPFLYMPSLYACRQRNVLSPLMPAGCRFTNCRLLTGRRISFYMPSLFYKLIKKEVRSPLYMPSLYACRQRNVLSPLMPAGCRFTNCRLITGRRISILYAVTVLIYVVTVCLPSTERSFSPYAG
jgi:hypothetical protein